MTEDLELAARLQRAMEPYQSMVYMVPEGATEYEAIGLDAGRMGYFASRSAPMGAVSAATVAAAFYSFSPDLIAEFIPRAWMLASVDQIIAARWRVADTALRRLLGDRIGSPEIEQASVLIRRATDGLSVSGRPCSPATPSWRGRTSRTCGCGWAPACCASTAATGTSPR